MTTATTQVFTCRNEYGERLQLVVDLERETAVLSSDDFDDTTIENDRIQNEGLILSDEELAWIARVWWQLFGRPVNKPRFNAITDLLQNLYQSLSQLERQRLFG